MLASRGRARTTCRTSRWTLPLGRLVCGHRRLGLGQVDARRPGAAPQPAPPARHGRVRARGLHGPRGRRAAGGRDARRPDAARASARGSTRPPTWASSSPCVSVFAATAGAQRARAHSRRLLLQLRGRGVSRCARAPATRRWSCSSCPTPSCVRGLRRRALPARDPRGPLPRAHHRRGRSTCPRPTWRALFGTSGPWRARSRPCSTWASATCAARSPRPRSPGARRSG